MNTFIPYLITSAVLILLLTLMVCLHLWVQHHRQPDAARLKILYGLLRFLFYVLLAMIAALIVCRDSVTSSATSVLVSVSYLLLVAGSVAFQIRQCERRLKRSDND